jgi:hypothetical protein
MKWLQDQNEINVDNLNNVRRGGSRNSTKQEYLKGKIDKHIINSKIKKSENCLGASVNLRITNLELI